MFCGGPIKITLWVSLGSLTCPKFGTGPCTKLCDFYNDGKLVHMLILLRARPKANLWESGILDRLCALMSNLDELDIRSNGQ